MVNVFLLKFTVHFIGQCNQAKNYTSFPYFDENFNPLQRDQTKQHDSIHKHYNKI